MGAEILPRPREAGLGQIPGRQRQPLRFHAPRPVARRQDEGMAAILPPGELAARTRPVTAPLRHPRSATHPARMGQARHLHTRYACAVLRPLAPPLRPRSEEHTSELQSLMRISYAVFCLKKKKHKPIYTIHYLTNRYSQQEQQHPHTTHSPNMQFSTPIANNVVRKHIN